MVNPSPKWRNVPFGVELSFEFRPDPIFVTESTQLCVR